jgi:hypothetical protein
MNTADDVRLRTWATEIATALLPEGATQSTEGHNARFHGAGVGGLSIVTATGVWFVHALGRGGESAIGLIQHLKGCSHAEAVEWAEAWLASHEGRGACDGVADAADLAAGAPAYAEMARDLLARAVPAEGTAAETYLRSRTLLPPYPDCVRFVADVRIGEHAILGVLAARGRIVGVQCGFLTPDGRKTPLSPQRKLYLLERDAGPEAVFAIRVPHDTSTATLVVAEGLEDGLAIAEATVAPWIVALPGIGGLVHLEARSGTPVTVFRHGDEPGSAADRGLSTGVDKLLLAGIAVRVVAAPPAADANSILQAAGPAGVADLLDQAAPAPLSLAGEVQRLSKLDPADYDRERVVVAKQFAPLRLPTLDALVAKALEKTDGGKSRTVSAELVSHEPEPAADPVQLAEVLDATEAAIKRHVVCSDAERTIIALWVAHTWVYTRFSYTPRLGLESPQPRCGKTRTVGVLKCLCHRPVEADGVTPATLIRLREAVGPATVLLDEMGDALKRSQELDDVLRSGFQADKRVLRMRQNEDGTYTHEAFDVHMPVVLAMVGAPVAALADRTIHIHLHRKPRTLRVAPLRQAGSLARLRSLAAQFARWAQDDGAALNPDPEVPETLNDRQADFALPLLTIAEQAGDTWAARARAALVAVLEGHDAAADDLGALLLRHLLPILTAFRQAAPESVPDDRLEVPSAELVQRLCQTDDAPWGEIIAGRPLTQHRLATLLAPFQVSPHNVGPEHARKRGYLWLRLMGVCRAYLSEPTPYTPSQSAQTAHSPGNSWDTGEFQSAQAASAVHSENTRKPAGDSHSVHPVHSEGGVRPPGFEEGPETSVLAPNEAEAHNQDGQNYSLQEAQGNEFPAPAKPPAAKPAAVPGKRPSAAVQMIRDLRVEHPEWTLGRIARSLGVSEAAVKRALKGWEPPPPDAPPTPPEGSSGPGEAA